MHIPCMCMCVCLQVLNSIFHIPGDEVVSAAVVEHQEHHQAMSSKWHRPADTCAPMMGPPYCTYGLRAPASCVLYAPEAHGSSP